MIVDIEIYCVSILVSYLFELKTKTDPMSEDSVNRLRESLKSLVHVKKSIPSEKKKGSSV